MTKNGLSRILPVGTALLLATLAGGCDFGPGHMMGQARLPASFASNGERIYFTGTSASGDPITFQGGDLHMTMMGAGCANCHGGALFTDHQFRNNGLAISDADPGRYEVTRLTLDRGTFATPSLRNIALTAPYMHDGRFQTLEEVLDHYSEGVQRTDTLDPNLAKHPDGGLHLTAEEKKAVIAFLKTLTDRRFEPAAQP